MTQQIEQLLNEHFKITGKVTIHPDGSVVVTGDVRLISIVSQIPVKFGSVMGNFDCSNNQLTSLEGAPNSVEFRFYCGFNQLTSLRGAPKSVGDRFSCRYNDLISLDGMPMEVNEVFFLSYNENLPLIRLITNQIENVFLEDAPDEVTAIINKYLNRRTRSERHKAAMSCTTELINAGYAGNAKL